MLPVPVPQQHWPLAVQQPTCTNVRIRSVDDAHKIFYGVRKGLLHMVTRRLDADERAALRTGCVYAWEERSPNTEITGLGIERFTEGRRWSASRVRDEFLFYYEKFVGDPNQQSTGSTPPADWKQLVKQTYSVWVDTGRGRKKWHLTAYFTQQTVDGLGTVDDREDVRKLVVPAGMFTSTRVGKRKNIDSDAAPQSTISRVYAPFPSPLPPLAPRPTKPGPSTSIVGRPPSPSVRMHDPYSRPPSQVHQLPPPPTYYGSADPQPSASTSQRPPLHYSYSPSVYPMSSPPPLHHDTRQDVGDYSRSDPALPPPPTQAQPYGPPYARARAHTPAPAPYHSAQQYPHPPPPPSGDWYTAPLAPYPPRQGSPRSDYTSSSSSSSSYASSGSPNTPAYPLYPPESPLFARRLPDTARALPRLPSPPEPYPIGLLSPTDAERRGEIGKCRDLAPLNSLRTHPYRRNPTDEGALRQLDPRPTF
ncbi:hypothetical protein B0H17DRAFT_1213712 [Mycena rosella]|uniref:cAMP-independent regulatory protein pac2 n=1 Tax=Mycena rosella TaxID=1033263 RepID=A0AAD7CPK9_MYCRO|nr:hypothetical protein B0H17DRAFT_1213712 [Mycena rosella]